MRRSYSHTGILGFSSLLIEADVDLDRYPRVLVEVELLSNLSHELTLGDLHGNALKLIHFLIREQILQGIGPGEYAELVRIYKTPVNNLNKIELDFFRKILHKTSANPRGIGMIRLIGDVLCDRGSNDFFTLWVIKRLVELKIPIEIIVSNHDVEFMYAYSKSSSINGRLELKPSYIVKSGFGRSMGNLILLLQQVPEMAAEIVELIEEFYVPRFKLLSYSLDTNQGGITLYTHAPVGLETLQRLADYCSTEFKAATVHQLATCIDQINQTASQRGGVVALYNDLLKMKEYNFLSKAETKAHPLYLLIWNRLYDFLQRPLQLNSIDMADELICYVHGHDQNEAIASQPHIINLDNYLGKNYSRDGSVVEAYGHQGLYQVLQVNVGQL